MKFRGHCNLNRLAHTPGNIQGAHWRCAALNQRDVGLAPSKTQIAQRDTRREFNGVARQYAGTNNWVKRLVVVDWEVRQIRKRPGILQVVPVWIALFPIEPIFVNFVPAVVGKRIARVVNDIGSLGRWQDVVSIGSGTAVQEIIALTADKLITRTGTPQPIVSITAVDELASTQFWAAFRIVGINEAALVEILLVDNIIARASVDE